MSSKREEERNEKIIRGLMKLPPNRRCINCNSLGPQYVCTNFWTFICMICSGVHREFTHRVKSVSMSKFTSQEVEALQNGGNQRARELFLKNWELQGQRLPNSNNVDKVREFIKAVYVNRKYVGGNKSEKPPSDTQSQRNIEEDTRRASSYHSYSQSPPYDFQYEDRLKRKQGGTLTRKPGSDRGLFNRKAVSFAYSPGRFSDNMYDDRFANEGSSSRASDYSVSSAGDPFRSGPQSPNLQKDDGFSSSVESAREMVGGVLRHTTSSYPETYAMNDANRVPLPRPQRTVSAGSFGSFDSNAASLQTVDSGSLFDVCPEPSGSSVITQNQASKIPFPQSSSENSGGVNHFKDPVAVNVLKSVPDMFQAPASGSAASIDLFQPLADSSVSSSFHTLETSLSSSSSYFDELSHKQSVTSLNQNLSEQSEPTNEGWATFDLPQQNVSLSDSQHATVSTAHSGGGISFANLNPVLSSDAGMQWPDVQSSTVHDPPPFVPNPLNGGNASLPGSEPSTQEWKAFDEDNEQNLSMDGHQGRELQFYPSSTTDQHLGLSSEGSGVVGFQKLASGEGASVPTESSFGQPVLPFMGELAPVGQKSGNPFDIDSEFEASNVFLDMSNLQAALPSTPIPSSYMNGIDESWFPSNPMSTPGGLPYMMSQASNSQLPNVPTHGPVASIGGNPFA